VIIAPVVELPRTLMVVVPLGRVTISDDVCKFSKCRLPMGT
jgi:hypothetical protein